MKKLESFELKVTTRSNLFYNKNIKDLESSLKKPERTSLLNTAINTGYYFFMFPFQLAKDGKLVKKRWQRVRKIIYQISISWFNSIKNFEYLDHLWGSIYFSTAPLRH